MNQLYKLEEGKMSKKVHKDSKKTRETNRQDKLMKEHNTRLSAHFD